MSWNNSMKNDKLRLRLKVTRTSIKNTGMLQPENSKSLQVPTVVARLIGYEKSRNTFFVGKHQNDVSFNYFIPNKSHSRM